MNLEHYSPALRTHSSEVDRVMTPTPSEEGLSHSGSLTGNLFSQAEDSDELLSPRIATYVMDEADESNVDETEYYLNTPRPKYVQGVMRGQQAYIITNLLGDGSRTLLQPQMVWTIGRNREAALPLRDRMMSRRHAVIMFVRREGFYLVDFNSMNGSYVNGARVTSRRLLQDGDFVRVGNTEFFFFISGNYRSVEALHPEVINRLMATEPKISSNHVDYSELQEEISFNFHHSSQ